MVIRPLDGVLPMATCEAPTIGGSALMYIFDSTPPVLSISARCGDESCDFIWLRNNTPVIVTEDCKIVPLDVHEGTPYIDIDRNH